MQKEELNIIEKGKKIYEVAKQNGDNISDVMYFEELELLESNNKFMGFDIHDVFIIERLEKKDNKEIAKYDLYNKDGKLIGNTNEKGEIEFSEEYKKEMEKLPDDIKKKIGFNERKPKIENLDKTKTIDKDIEKAEEKEKTDQKTEKYEEKDEQQEVEQIEKDLGLNEKDIKASSKITDKEFFKLVPEAKNFEEISIIYASDNRFKIVGLDKKTNKYMELETVESSQAVPEKTSISLGRDGSDIQKEKLKSVLKIKGNIEYSFAANLEVGRPIEFKKLRMDRTTGKYISSPVETSYQRPTSYEVEKMMNQDKNRDVVNEVEKFEKQEELGDNNITIEEIDDNEEKEKSSGEEKNIWDHPSWN